MKREDALDRIRVRAERLLKLLELKAPDVIVQNECHLVMQAGRWLDPENWEKIVREHEESKS